MNPILRRLVLLAPIFALVAPMAARATLPAQAASSGVAEAIFCINGPLCPGDYQSFDLDLSLIGGMVLHGKAYVGSMAGSGHATMESTHKATLDQPMTLSGTSPLGASISMLCGGGFNFTRNLNTTVALVKGTLTCVGSVSGGPSGRRTIALTMIGEGVLLTNDTPTCVCLAGLGIYRSIG